MERVALAIEWSTNGITTRLSIEGLPEHASAYLSSSTKIVDPSVPASEWIENFRDALLAEAPDLEGDVNWPTSAARVGRLMIDHEEETTFIVHLPRTVLSPLRKKRDSAAQS